MYICIYRHEPKLAVNMRQGRYLAPFRVRLCSFFFLIVGVPRFRQRLTAFLAHIVHVISHALFLTVTYALAPVASTTLQRASRREYEQWLAMSHDLLAFV